MDERIVSYIRLNALLGDCIYLIEELGKIKCPRICDLDGNLLIYNSNLIKCF
jgi:hypothetical protein